MNIKIISYIETSVISLIFTLLTVCAASANEEVPPVLIDLGNKFSLNSTFLSDQRDIFIRLPNDYTTSKKNYPVVYLLDTNNDVMTYLDNIYFHSVSEIQRLMTRGAIPEVIVVGISIPRAKWYRDVVAQPDPFRNFIVKELMPHVNKNYRTLDNNMMIGQSYSGVFVVNTLAKSLNVFDTLVAVDPILVEPSLEKAIENLTHINSSQTNLLIAKSGGDFEEIDLFQQAIYQQKGDQINITVEEYADESHASVYYPALNTSLRRHFSDYRSLSKEQVINENYHYRDIVNYHANSDKKYQSEPNNQKLQESIFQVIFSKLREKKFDNAFKLWDKWESRNKAYNLNRIIDIFIRRDELSTAIALLNKMIEIEPGQPSTHYRLAKLFEGTGDTNNAKKQWTEINAILTSINSPAQQRHLNTFGYQLLGDKKFAQAIDVFSKLVQAFPQSENAYDSLGEAYEVSGQIENAVAALSTAVDLAIKQNNANLAMYQSSLKRVQQKALTIVN